MKRTTLCLSLFLLFIGNAAFGQLSVMMGRVLDATGKPVAGAELKISGKKAYYKVKTDADGIYNSPLLEPHSYRVIIDADGKYFSVERVKVVKPCQEPEFYNFVLAGDHVELQTDHGKDPAMVAKLEKIEEGFEKADKAKK